MPAEQFERAKMVVTAFRDQLSPETCETVGEQGFADLTLMIQEALQRERGDVAGQFEALAKALRATSEPVDIGL